MSTSQFKPNFRMLYGSSLDRIAEYQDRIRALDDDNRALDDDNKKMNRALDKQIKKCRHLGNHIKDRDKEIEMLKDKLQCKQEKPNNIAAAVTSVCILGLSLIHI